MFVLYSIESVDEPVAAVFISKSTELTTSFPEGVGHFGMDRQRSEAIGSDRHHSATPSYTVDHSILY